MLRWEEEKQQVSRANRPQLEDRLRSENLRSKAARSGGTGTQARRAAQWTCRIGGGPACPPRAVSYPAVQLRRAGGKEEAGGRPSCDAILCRSTRRSQNRHGLLLKMKLKYVYM